MNLLRRISLPPWIVIGMVEGSFVGRAASAFAADPMPLSALSLSAPAVEAGTA